MKAGETMLRSSQPLLPFLAPAAYRQPTRRVAFVARHCRAQPIQSSATRSFSTSLRRQQDSDSPRKQYPSSATSAQDAIGGILDGALDGKKGTPTTPSARTTRYASNNAQNVSTPSRAQLESDKQQDRPVNSSMDSSINDLLASMTSAGTVNRSSPRDIARSLNPRGMRSGPPPLPQPAPMKLGPTLGKTVYVDNQRGIDVARAFRSMEIRVARNKVRYDANKQRFHERGGKKRKRLHSERWRKRFKLGFQAVVKRVLKMKKQGW